jgi:hypothetical protein
MANVFCGTATVHCDYLNFGCFLPATVVHSLCLAAVAATKIAKTCSCHTRSLALFPKKTLDGFAG